MASFIKTMAAATLVLMISSADAHMIMKSPVPYGKSTLNNSPLVADGSDFPCKQRTGVYDLEGAENVLAIGEPQTLSFTGSAVHGGGSCQVSLTTDLQPTKDSKWMVIKSIEGGCPASVAGNLPADPNGDGASTFQYTIPEGISPGQYTIAWSWINKIGNREFYMNCGPATVTAAKKKRYAPAPKISKRQTSFPDMFVANLASVNDCTTPESFDYVYPNPGQVVQSAGTGPYTTLSCGAAGGSVAAEQPTASPDAGSGSAAATVATSVATQATGDAGASSVEPTFAGSVDSQPTGGSGPGVFATGAASPSTTTETPEVVPVSTAAPAATGTSSTTTTTTTGTQSGPCTDEGAWSCSADGSSFQRCASGTWSVALAMDAGMKCQPGVSDTFVTLPGKAKRHSHGHLRRMAGLFGGSYH
ncbi:hypothetical protein A1O3_00564 [Capronia epimyces CBS 606.96]|uniref:DNA-directed RNA polymerase n=1 Tax=Capronia epimyces CBS 606.96 TaxID=1182542 RepID=W9ZBX9_9EURO|nr:uncharacterized protein A1O3_00564 [Capronia epimyces CBS 606.96]EXJ92014.1 hypothetical protein A1O3_00564 [Capronia epimyces CBS 606.96]